MNGNGFLFVSPLRFLLRVLMFYKLTKSRIRRSLVKFPSKFSADFDREQREVTVSSSLRTDLMFSSAAIFFVSSVEPKLE